MLTFPSSKPEPTGKNVAPGSPFLLVFFYSVHHDAYSNASTDIRDLNAATKSESTKSTEVAGAWVKTVDTFIWPSALTDTPGVRGSCPCVALF